MNIRVCAYGHDHPDSDYSFEDCETAFADAKARAQELVASLNLVPAASDPFTLVQAAIEKIGEHDGRCDCDTLEIAEALVLLDHLRDRLRPSGSEPRSGFEELGS